MVHENGTSFLEPEGTNDTIVIGKDHKVILYCSQGFTFSPLHRLDAVCLGRNRYGIQQANGLMKTIFDLKCNGLPEHKAVKKGTCDNGNATAIDIGFEIDEIGLLPVMEICHNEREQRTHYVRFVLKPSNYLTQGNPLSPEFQKGDFYGKIPINYLYTQDGQLQTFYQLLGPNRANLYIQKTSHVSVTRGHLMAKGDLIFGVLQLATYYFLNAAGQWEPINSGNWGKTETTLRAFVADEGIRVEVYTGTIGILHLPDCKGRLVPMYLNVGGQHREVNGECYTPRTPEADTGFRTNPIPQFIYKAVINREEGTGVVFVSLNNIYANLREGLDALKEICTDVSDKVTWMVWTQTVKKGYMAACEVKDFVSKAKHLPSAIADNIDGLLLRKLRAVRVV